MAAVAPWSDNSKQKAPAIMTITGAFD